MGLNVDEFCGWMLEGAIRLEVLVEARRAIRVDVLGGALDAVGNDDDALKQTRTHDPRSKERVTH